ncbi:hypothetical protein KSP39_PZI000954 [Platanthera zijinensis]|uniref:Retrotransposon gag domain-containing protein n=1 Tax=Platanthera zijinensis TaxID=2320716 RepID=A0AAP0GFT8_9ASPA
MPWLEFVDGFTTCFGPLEYENFEALLLKLRQKRTVMEYRAEFERLANRVEWEERTLMSCFVSGLKKGEGIVCGVLDYIDKIFVLWVGGPKDHFTLEFDMLLAKSSRELSKFAVVALVDIDAEELNIYVKYFDIVLIPSTVFFFNAHHMKMDSGTPDHTKWVGSFQCKQDFIDVVEAIYRGAMKGKLIVSCPLPPEKIPRFQLLFKDV